MVLRGHALRDRTSRARRVWASSRTPRQHNTFTAVNEQFEAWTGELQDLKPRQAYVKVEGRPAIKMRTTRIREPRVSSSQLADVLSTYRQTYQRTQEEAERAIVTLTLPLPVSRSSSAPAYTQLYKAKESLSEN
jgi:hypothetical protein